MTILHFASKRSRNEVDMKYFDILELLSFDDHFVVFFFCFVFFNLGLGRKTESGENKKTSSKNVTKDNNSSISRYFIIFI